MPPAPALKADAPRTFHPFPRLPQELQDMIWERVHHPQRLLSFTCTNTSVSPEGFRIFAAISPRDSRIHPLLHACRGSRAAFKRRPSVAFGPLEARVFSEIIREYCGVPPGCKVTYFPPLYLDRTTDDMVPVFSGMAAFYLAGAFDVTRE